MERELPPLIAVVGPTGAGKSDLGLHLAVQLGGEIVNCDSLQIYRYLDIGTAKTPIGQRRGVPHHLIDMINPDEEFTAGDYSRSARHALNEVAQRGVVPIVVGGTGFYLRALLNGLFEGPTRNPELRQRLTSRSPKSLHRILGRFDPVAAARIHTNDRQKLIRALEVCLTERKPMTDLFRTRVSPALTGFRVIKLGLDPERDVLRERLGLRSRRMFERGLADELRAVLSMGFHPGSKALQSIGYREAGLLLAGELDVTKAIELTFVATAQYAKRQRTWFRKEPDVRWFAGFGTDPQVVAAAAHHVNDAIS